MPESLASFTSLTVEPLPAGITVVSLAVPGHAQNVMTEDFLRDLGRLLDAFDREPPRGLVLQSARSGSFCAGADIERLERLGDLPESEVAALCNRGRRLLDRLSGAGWPSVAVIDGVCLGGGLELALACDLRVATTSGRTSLGAPEVKLGLLPGWGGTVRLPRLIGPGPAIEMIVTGEPVNGARAATLGLVDACVPPETATASAVALLEQTLATKDFQTRRQRQAAPVVIDGTEREFLEATSAALILGRTGGHYPAPLTALDTVLRGCDLPAAEAAAGETAAFVQLTRSSVARQLVRVFLLGERNRRDSGLGDPQGANAPVGAGQQPAVVGAGIMGAGIVARHLRSGITTTLVDIDSETLARSVPSILTEAAWDRHTQASDPQRAVQLAGLLRASTDRAAIAGADLVIESVIERTDLKRQVLAEIEATVAASAIICTNTSTNPIATLAAALTDPSRFCGMHFFNPVRRMKLVEVIRGPATSDATVAAVVAHAKRLGKYPVVVQDSPGFLVNRVLTPYLHEAVELLREGIDPARIDRLARRFGMPLGPLELYDMVGLDTAFYAGLVMASAIGDRIESSPVIPGLVKAGRLGRKTGSGFYRYRGRGHDARLETVDERLAEAMEPYRLPDRTLRDADITDRLFLPMLLEALLVLDEGIVRDGRDVDLAVIHALGFPAFRGGLLAWGDSLGAAEVLTRLARFADLGLRMVPPPRLRDHAASGRPFVPES
jgi:3-hydroxyacyl-CoA dehydrogenase/enoyl-CoA hydratase/3-hydroxybutyryl-CoA epimerase/3-hydroxyacyl-CoA dehydrogenase/enoyl-CoA hydratase/3-hydroxybutyryl-CoA epimerase/enoyl-CoA isomerase